ncbi:MAG: SLBB domain-containing protein [Phenylobacterium sp.]|uniref:polysaccharide biosynthesis/export family protein n=1 Tax=Phenylobacterium sp. TaxID=1871053 RepID=UPI001A614DB1|nr:polysaccharide biosynthesis/export family protein [Phenylobacterium sp.]MBL8770970.1 SLBB domain-containing protein [Phenylobacterium sp.]
MKIKTLLIALLASVVTVFGGASFAQTPAAASQPEAAQAAQAAPGLGDSASSDYVLGRDDRLVVGLLGRTDFGGTARVQADGTIQLPLIGKVQAADRTTAELAEAVRKALQAGQYFADPIVTVEVVGYASRYVTVLGSVGAPGLIPMNRPYRLSEILARVGGIRDGGADFIVVRSASGEEKRYSVRDLSMGGAEQDPYVVSGDKIFAPPAEQFYIYGQVNSPGAYALATGMTVRMAIAKAGGLTPSGSDKKIDATRSGKKTKLDMAAEIQPGDVLVVGERMF